MSRLLVIFLLLTQTSLLQASELTKSAIFEKLKSLTNMRESLANTIQSQDKITMETFKAVCQPVGIELKRWSAENSLTSGQISHKNRNEKNRVPTNLQSVYDDFLANPKLENKMITTSLDNIEGKMYLSRISVGNSCLKCHGEKSSRPDFIKSKFKTDKAFDFKVGDLRGIYWVFKSK